MIFFIGGFIYDVLDAHSSPGESARLPLPRFWHVVKPSHPLAVVFAAMLASNNNPSTLQGTIGRVQRSQKTFKSARQTPRDNKLRLQPSTVPQRRGTKAWSDRYLAPRYISLRRVDFLVEVPRTSRMFVPSWSDESLEDQLLCGSPMRSCQTCLGTEWHWLDPAGPLQDPKQSSRRLGAPFGRSLGVFNNCRCSVCLVLLKCDDAFTGFAS